MRLSAPYSEQVGIAAEVPNGGLTWARIFRTGLCYRTRIRHQVINYGAKPVRIGIREQDSNTIENDNYVDSQPRWRFFTITSKNSNNAGTNLTGGVVRNFTSTHSLASITKQKVFQEDNFKFHLAEPLVYPVPPPVDASWLQLRARNHYNGDPIAIQWHMWVEYKIKYTDFKWVNDRPLADDQSDDNAGYDEGADRVQIDADSPSHNTAAPSG